MQKGAERGNLSGPKVGNVFPLGLTRFYTQGF
jgi:hypothetical protein